MSHSPVETRRVDFKMSFNSVKIHRKVITLSFIIDVICVICKVNVKQSQRSSNMWRKRVVLQEVSS